MKTMLIRDRSLTTSKPLLGGKFFTGKKHEGGQILSQQQQSREFDVSDLSSIPWFGKKKELDIWREFMSRGKGCLTWSRKNLEPSSQSASLKITQKGL